MNTDRVLAIDHGEARIGLALSDELGMFAHPLETVPGRDPDAAADRIAELVRERGVGTVLIGLPLRMDGTEGTAVERMRAFSKTLRPRLDSSVVWIEIDERLSTVSAMEKMRAAGRTVRNSRGQIDQAAAMEILQEYLDARSGAGPVADEWDEDEDGM